LAKDARAASRIRSAVEALAEDVLADALDARPVTDVPETEVPETVVPGGEPAEAWAEALAFDAELGTYQMVDKFRHWW
jgi:hypothetical protein